MYASDLEDSVSQHFHVLEEQSHYEVGDFEAIEDLVSKIESLKYRKYAGPDGREEVISEITSQLASLTDQDLIEIRTLVQLKSKNLQQKLFVR